MAKELRYKHDRVVHVAFLELIEFLFNLQKRDPDKRIWLVTYGSGCPSVTHDMLRERGVYVDECYTVTWRESKYTLFRLSKQNRFRASTISKVMLSLKESYGIVGSGLFGFGSVSCNDEKKEELLIDHPGFRKMVDVLNDNPDALSWWMVTGDLVSNRKGLLWRHIEMTDPSSMTRAQLMERVIKWSPIVKEAEILKETNNLLGRRLQETEQALKESVDAFNKELKCSDDFFNQLRLKIRECRDLQEKNAELQEEHNKLLEKYENLQKIAGKI